MKRRNRPEILEPAHLISTITAIIAPSADKREGR